MTSSDDIASGIDWREYADHVRSERKYTSPCRKCWSPDPVRVDAEGCSDCIEYPRCTTCGGFADVNIHSDCYKPRCGLRSPVGGDTCTHPVGHGGTYHGNRKSGRSWR